ncbi:AAA family ATPase [Nonomuraea sp. H19]|uniref:AAA family ATPase n=1 Tax=Nonomuraea sp. H19 TaxID=3452206 RepID=UPI003F8C25C5
MTTGNVPPPDDGNDHLQQPDGANLVATEALHLTHADLRFVLEERAMACLYGDSGVGKTTMVNATVRHLAPGDSIYVSCCADASSLRHGLFDALGLQGPRPWGPREYDKLLTTALAEKFRVLVCDDAHNLTAHCFEWWRFLWDNRDTDTAIVFVGEADYLEVLAPTRSPMMVSRIALWRGFKRMPLVEVLDAIPIYHPIWADADPALIELADRKAAHGNWRAWAHLTADAARALEQLQRPILDEDVLRYVLDRLRPQ